MELYGTVYYNQELNIVANLKRFAGFAITSYVNNFCIVGILSDGGQVTLFKSDTKEKAIEMLEELYSALHADEISTVLNQV